MRDYAIKQEETRLNQAQDEMEYPEPKERHRVFPAVFENRKHQRILDTSAGIGYSAKRILEQYPAKLVCNEISPSCFPMLKKLNTPVLSFDLDNGSAAFPFQSGYFDAVISLVTIEHLLNVDHYLQEINRVLCEDGWLYIATPNYAAPEYMITPLIHGKTFHDPLIPASRYEFYAHVRYFTYVTLVEFVSCFGFTLDTVYIAEPGGSARYQKLLKASKWKAYLFRTAMSLRHRALAPRWASEPILCFLKTQTRPSGKSRKVVL